jgi:tetratricopeptide (TPR) repeat protein
MKARPSPSDSLLRCAALELRRSCGTCARTFAELEATLRRRIGSDGSRAPEAWEAARLGLVDPQRVLRRAHTVAARGMKSLRPLTAEARHQKVKHARTDFRTPAHAELFFAEAGLLLRRDPRQALEWLDLADEVVFWLPVHGYSPGVVATLALRATALRANALRVAGDLRAADELFRRLRVDRRRSLVAEVEVHAELASLEASLRQDQRRFDDADALLAWAARLCRLVDDREGAAKALIQQGVGRFHRGEPAAALPFLRQAAALVDLKQAPRRYLEVQHNLAVCLCQLGAHEEAAAIVDANRAVYARFPEPWTQLFLQWLEARLARAAGAPETAKRHLLAAREGYLAQGLAYDAALVTFDLAEVLVEQGGTAEVQRLAEETVAVFSGQEVQAEVEHALRLFQKAAAAERIGLVLLARLRRYLEGGHRVGRPFGRLPD